MGLRTLEQHADRLAREAARLEAERNVHAARCLSILRARLATPGALALCFGAGMLAGQPGTARPARREAGREDEPEKRTAGLLTGPLGAAAVRLASAYLIGAWSEPERTP